MVDEHIHRWKALYGVLKFLIDRNDARRVVNSVGILRSRQIVMTAKLTNLEM